MRKINLITSFMIMTLVVGRLTHQPIFSNLKQKAEDVLAFNHCNAKIIWSDVVMSYSCLIHSIYPKIGFERSLELVRPKIDSIDKVYDISKTQFDFQWSELLASNIIPLSDYESYIKKKSFLSKMIAELTHQKMIIPLETLALDQIQSYGIVAADRDISKYGDCAKKNFMVGMKAMEQIRLEPGQKRNANSQFAYLPGYCKGEGEHFMFYQWICGVSSMAYRASILNPNVTITKRSNHTKRYTRYYGDDIYGDDAAIYEDIKQFEILNDSSEDLMIKSKIIWDRPYLVFIHPRKLSSSVAIHKSQTGPLTAQITRSWKDVNDGDKLKTETRNSRYTATTNASN